MEHAPSAPRRPLHATNQRQQPRVPSHHHQPHINRHRPQQQRQQPPPSNSDQVSILVKPLKGGASTKNVLLNVPRKVALKVKPGTTLSFSASNDQKYTVIDSKIHPPVKAASSSSVSRPPILPSSHNQQQRPLIPQLPRGLSLQPVKRSNAPGTSLSHHHHRPTASITRTGPPGGSALGGQRRPMIPSGRFATASGEPARKKARASVLSTGEV